MTNTTRIRRSNPFTLVEVIAVLLVIAILAAVAAPKFVSMATEARRGVARAGINEAKSSLSVAYAKAYLIQQGEVVTIADVIANANLGTNPVTFGDILVNLTAGTDIITLTATSVRGTPVSNVNDTWTLPIQ